MTGLTVMRAGRDSMATNHVTTEVTARGRFSRAQKPADRVAPHVEAVMDLVVPWIQERFT